MWKVWPLVDCLMRHASARRAPAPPMPEPVANRDFPWTWSSAVAPDFWTRPGSGCHRHHYRQLNLGLQAVADRRLSTSRRSLTTACPTSGWSLTAAGARRLTSR